LILSVDKYCIASYPTNLIPLYETFSAMKIVFSKFMQHQPRLTLLSSRGFAAATVARVNTSGITSSTSDRHHPTTTTTSSTTTTSRRFLNVAARPSDLVGHTPLLDLTNILKAHGVNNGCKLYGKMESMEPCSSVKDRLGRAMIDGAEAEGKITPGKTVLVEPTSGNTGIALAFIARERGYRCILTMPETMSIERRMMLLALGAEVVRKTLLLYSFIRCCTTV
jgi:hypothetical protein